MGLTAPKVGTARDNYGRWWIDFRWTPPGGGFDPVIASLAVRCGPYRDQPQAQAALPYLAALFERHWGQAPNLAGEDTPPDDGVDPAG